MGPWKCLLCPPGGGGGGAWGGGGALFETQTVSFENKCPNISYLANKLAVATSEEQWALIHN